MSGFLFVLVIVVVALSPVFHWLATMERHPAPYDWAEADPACPSCGGTGWAVARVAGVAYAQGQCRCMGGEMWVAADDAAEVADDWFTFRAARRWMDGEL